MKKICIHWSAGTYSVGQAEFEHYHYMVNNTGIVTKGKFHPHDNRGPGPLKEGRYAAHCGGGNTDCIGVSMLGMRGFKNARSIGDYPLTAQQFEATCKLVAQLCQMEGIEVTPDTVFTHYEFGKKHPNTKSRGKIDIIFLPHQPELKAHEVGDHFRSKVRWYLSKLPK